MRTHNNSLFSVYIAGYSARTSALDRGQHQQEAATVVYIIYTTTFVFAEKTEETDLQFLQGGAEKLLTAFIDATQSAVLP